jgi:hypothetical protein
MSARTRNELFVKFVISVLRIEVLQEFFETDGEWLRTTCQWSPQEHGSGEQTNA